MIQARLRKNYLAKLDSRGFTLDLEFSAAAGVTVLFGPSGSGKTLVLDCIAGFVRPDEGRILVDDELLFDGATGVHLAPQARHCGYVFQNYALFPHMTLRENLAFAVERRPRLERHRRVNEALERYRIADCAGLRPHEVSGGQRQRCSIARALIGEPKLLLLDEPTQGLDAPLRAELYEVLRQVRADFKTPVVLVTHDLDECFELGEEMLILREGRLVQNGPPRKILDQPANLEVARLLGAFNLLPCARSREKHQQGAHGRGRHRRPVFSGAAEGRPRDAVRAARAAQCRRAQWKAGSEPDGGRAAPRGGSSRWRAPGVRRRNFGGFVASGIRAAAR
jgi:molybdate transport system ATP-binding protein